MEEEEQWLDEMLDRFDELEVKTDQLVEKLMPSSTRNPISGFTFKQGDINLHEKDAQDPQMQSSASVSLHAQKMDVTKPTTVSYIYD